MISASMPWALRAEFRVVLISSIIGALFLRLSSMMWRISA